MHKMTLGWAQNVQKCNGLHKKCPQLTERITQIAASATICGSNIIPPLDEGIRTMPTLSTTILFSITRFALVLIAQTQSSVSANNSMCKQTSITFKPQ